MSKEIGQEVSWSSKQNTALSRDEHKNIKKGKKVESNSSSSEREEEEDNQGQASMSSSNDEEMMELIRGMKKMIGKIRSKGVPITIEDIMFTNQRKI